MVHMAGELVQLRLVAVSKLADESGGESDCVHACVQQLLLLHAGVAEWSDIP